MGEIVLHGQKFKIKGDTPTPREQVAIDSYLDFREQSSGLTGNKTLDEQAIISLKPEDVLSETNKGKYNKDTEGFLNSPSFKRLVAEVGLSIVGGIAGAALAPVTGGASLAASAGLAARVARLARPLINISANTVSKIGAGTAGAAIGGGTGAALAQTFDPKEDIVREVTRGVLQGGLGELAGFGLAGGLSKVYNKITKAKVNEVFGATRALNVLEREKNFFGELLKIKNAGQLTAKEIEDLVASKTFTPEQISILKDPIEARKLINSLDNKFSPDFLVKRVEKAAITPGLAVENTAIDLMEGMSKSSFFGGPLIRAQGYATNTLAEGMDAFGEAIIRASAKDSIDPNGLMVGKLIQDSLTRNKQTWEILKTNMWRDFATDGKRFLYKADGTAIDEYLVNIGSKNKVKMYNPQIKGSEPTTSLKEFAKDKLAEIRGSDVTGKFGPDSQAEDILARIAQLPDNISYTDLNDIYTRIQRELNPTSPLQNQIRGELTKRFVHYQDTAKLPAELNGVRQTVVGFSKMGADVFEDGMMKKILSTNRGQEKIYDQIVLANNESTTKHFLNLIDKKVAVPGSKTLRPLFDNPQEIKDALRGQFFRDFLNQAKDVQGPYEVLKPISAYKFLEKYDAFVKKSGLISKEQINNLEDYVTALRFSEGTITRPGVSGKAATVMIQLKQAGAVSQLATLGLGAGGYVDLGTVGTILVGPAVLARAFANPKATKLLIEGLKFRPRNFGQYERYMTQLTSNFVGQGYIGADQARLVMEEIKANEDNLTEFFNGKIPTSANTLPKRPADEPELNLNEQVLQERLSSQRATGQLPNVTPSNVGSISPQARMALAGGNLDQAIAAQSMQQMPQLKRGGIVSAKK